MLKFSKSDDQLPYSRNNLPPNPPLTTILEQCFWSDNSAKFYYINKYNDRCASRNSPKIDQKYEKKSRPFTAQGRFCHFEKRDRTKKFSCLSFSDESDDEKLNKSSRSSTPDFMHEVYDTYSDLNAVNLLLRRPVSSENNRINNESVSTTNKKNIEASLSENQREKKTVLTKNNDPLQFMQQKKTVTIDIPVCDKLSDAEDTSLLPRLASSLTQSSVFTDVLEDKDDIRSISSSRSTEINKPVSPVKKKIKRKKLIKKKIETSATKSNVSRDESNQSVDRSKKIKSLLKNDDIVTQMSALGLSKQRDEELTPVLLRKLRVPRPANSTYAHSNPISYKDLLSIPSKAPSKFIKTSKTNEILSTRRRRTIPIQIVSDPFKCPANKKNESFKLHRPHTVNSPSNTRCSDEVRLRQFSK